MENIDEEMQRRFGGIKPLEDQFPGYEEGISPQDFFESDVQRLKNLSKGQTKGTATIALIHQGQILMGQRRDNGKWTFPGGGLGEGEDPQQGAARELFEEAGIRAKPSDLKEIASKVVEGREGYNVLVHCFKLELSQKVQSNSYNDPDHEVRDWVWVDASNGLPAEVMDNLHSPKNLLLQSLGLQKDLFKEEIRRMSASDNAAFDIHQTDPARLKAETQKVFGVVREVESKGRVK